MKRQRACLVFILWIGLSLSHPSSANDVSSLTQRAGVWTDQLTIAVNQLASAGSVPDDKLSQMKSALATLQTGHAKLKNLKNDVADLQTQIESKKTQLDIYLDSERKTAQRNFEAEQQRRNTALEAWARWVKGWNAEVEEHKANKPDPTDEAAVAAYNATAARDNADMRRREAAFKASDAEFARSLVKLEEVIKKVAAKTAEAIRQRQKLDAQYREKMGTYKGTYESISEQAQALEKLVRFAQREYSVSRRPVSPFTIQPSNAPARGTPPREAAAEGSPLALTVDSLGAGSVIRPPRRLPPPNSVAGPNGGNRTPAVTVPTQQRGPSNRTPDPTAIPRGQNNQYTTLQGSVTPVDPKVITKSAKDLVDTGRYHPRGGATFCNYLTADLAKRAFNYDGFRPTGKDPPLIANWIVDHVRTEPGWQALHDRSHPEREEMHREHFYMPRPGPANVRPGIRERRRNFQEKLTRAQELANQGYLVVIGYKNHKPDPERPDGKKSGHVAVVVPSNSLFKPNPGAGQVDAWTEPWRKQGPQASGIQGKTLARPYVANAGNTVSPYLPASGGFLSHMSVHRDFVIYVRRHE